MAKKWPGMVVQRSFIKGHSFQNRVYLILAVQLKFYKDDSIILLDSASPDGTTYNLGIQTQHQILISSQLR